jgi:hypothetical protein
VAPLAASNGGYWPVAWGWSTIALAWLAVVALLVRERVRLGIHERLVLLTSSAFLGWILIGLTWTLSTGRTVLEAERASVFVAGLLAAILVVRSRCYRHFLGGVVAAIWVVSAYALATRLFPERLGVFSRIAGNRLSEPLGYWNALGIFVAIGSLLALGFAARGRTTLVRGLAASALVTLLPTLYFTFSRGACLALALGVLGAVALDPRRLQFVTAILALSPAPGIAVALAYRSDALTRPLTTVPASAHAGHRLALAVIALAVANALVAVGLHLAERRAVFPQRARFAYAALLVLIALGAAVSVFARYGDPVSLTKRGYHSFTAAPPAAASNLNDRLFSLSSNGRIDLWKTAWGEGRDHPLTGSGAGTFELYWLSSPRNTFKARDAHSLYLEAFGELGPVGLALLLAVLLIPVSAAVVARKRSLVPAAFGAYLAYLIHAGVDWDWEMTAVTLSAAFCGIGLIVAARRPDRPKLSRRGRLLLVFASSALALFAFVGLVGNSKVDAASSAADSHRWALSEARGRATMRWMPWSGEPWRLVGESQLARRQFAAARKTLQTGLTKDPRSWELWLDLSLVTRGTARRQAATRALALNPGNGEVAAVARQLHIARRDRAGG